MKETIKEMKKIIKFKSNTGTDFIFLNSIKYENIFGNLVAFLHLEDIAINDGDDVSPYLNKGYLISKRSALRIDCVTEAKLRYVRHHPAWGICSYNYSLDDVIAISEKTVKELKLLEETSY